MIEERAVGDEQMRGRREMVTWEWIRTDESATEMPAVHASKNHAGAVVGSTPAKLASLLRVRKLSETAVVPSRATEFSAGYDLSRVSLEGTREGVKGHLTIAAEIFELTPLLVMVEVKKKGGDKGEFDDFCARELKPALQNLKADGVLFLPLLLCTWLQIPSRNERFNRSSYMPSGGQSNILFCDDPVCTTKKINGQKFSELSGNDIFKGDVPPVLLCGKATERCKVARNKWQRHLCRRERPASRLAWWPS